MTLVACCAWLREKNKMDEPAWEDRGWCLRRYRLWLGGVWWRLLVRG